VADGRGVVSSAAGKLRLWSISDGAELAHVGDGTTEPLHAFCSDGRAVAWTDGRALEVRDCRDGSRWCAYISDGRILALAWAGETIILGSASGCVMLQPEGIEARPGVDRTIHT
jgi:hypothetical protein